MRDTSLVSYQHLLVTRDDTITTITLNRPEKRNALAFDVMTELLQAFRDVGASDALGVVLAANGPVFSAGHNFGDMAGTDLASARRLLELCTEMMDTIQEIPQPVIAKVHALATAAGCQLVASCDLAVASSAARFATPGVDIGLFCTTPAVALQRTVAPKHAMELLLTGEPISAHDAWRIGLVNRVVEPEALASEVGALAELIAAKPAATVESGKASVRRLGSLALRDAYREASAAMASGLVAPEAVEGIGAFLEKRSPRWPER